MDAAACQVTSWSQPTNAPIQIHSRAVLEWMSFKMALHVYALLGHLTSVAFVESAQQDKLINRVLASPIPHAQWIQTITQHQANASAIRDIWIFQVSASPASKANSTIMWIANASASPWTKKLIHKEHVCAVLGFTISMGFVLPAQMVQLMMEIVAWRRQRQPARAIK